MNLALRRLHGIAPSGSVSAAVDIINIGGGIALLAGAVYAYKRHPFASGVMGTMGVGWIASDLAAHAIDSATALNNAMT